MLELLKLKFRPKTVILDVDTGEGKGSYGEFLNPIKFEPMCITGAVPAVSTVSGFSFPWLYHTGTYTPPAPKIDPPELGEFSLDKCEQCGEPAWDGRICHSCGAKNI